MDPRELHSFRKSLTEDAHYFWQHINGDLIDASQVPTRHIFYTMVILWNKYAPASVNRLEHSTTRTRHDLKSKEYPHLFSASLLGPEHAPEAIRFLLDELRFRKDMKLSWNAEAAFISLQLKYAENLLNGRTDGTEQHHPNPGHSGD